MISTNGEHTLVNTKRPERLAFLTCVRNTATSRLLRGLTRCDSQDSFPLVREFHAPLGASSCPESLWTWNPKAVIAHLTPEQAHLIREIHQRGWFVVHTTNCAAERGEAVVLADAVPLYEGVHKHFEELGVHQIVQVHSGHDRSWDVSRLRYQDFCLTRGFACHQVLIREEPPEIYSPTLAGAVPPELAGVLAGARGRIGIFTQQNFTGPYLVRSLVKAGIAVPGQVAVIGSDECDVSLWCKPSMTMIRLPREEVGYRAGCIALDMIAGIPSPSGHVRLPGAHLVLGGSTKTRRGEVALARALDYLDQHACEGITVHDVVYATQSVTRQTFTREFQKWTGQTPGTAIRERQMQEAKRLLRDTDDSITAIALACGFCDDIEFRRRFRGELGLSPRAYRNLFTGQCAR